LYVKTHHEKLVAAGLRGKGYTEFLPLYRARHRSAGRFKDVDLPLLPNYVFCRFRSDRRTPILATPGVFHIVAVAGTPAPVDEIEIANLQRVVDSGICARPWPFLKVGDRVRIEEGPLRGTHGILEVSKDENRLIVSVTLLQRSVAVNVDRRWVRPQGLRTPRCDETAA
jgi:transcription antitermination factor NusG